LRERRVRFTATAQGHIDRERHWWLEHRDHRDIFAAELEDGVKILTLLPGAGAPYPEAGVAGLRRLYLEKITCHIYYTFDDEQVIVRALWGARRGRGPFFGSSKSK
jgi:plasmid stabilization system protein ParE